MPEYVALLLPVRYKKWKFLKQTIQMAIIQSIPWKPAVTAFLMDYRATPHATTGVSPFQLLHGRKMRTKLTVLPPSQNDDVPDSLIRRRVAQAQQKMKVYTDHKRGARMPVFQQGDRVRVKTPHHVPKAHPKLSKPQRIKKSVARGTYLLEDGKRWNARHLTRCYTEASGMQNTSPVLSPPVNCTPPADPPSSLTGIRVRKKPPWLKDYVTD